MSTTALQEIHVAPPTRKFRPYSAHRSSRVWGIPALPEHWQEKPLQRVASINTDKLSEATDPDYEIEYVDIGNVNLEAGITSRVRHGDTIVSTVRTYLKAVAQVVNPPENLIVSTGFAVIRATQSLNPGFLYRLAQSEPLVERIMAHSVGVSYPAINASDIGKFAIPIPPPDEQQAIAAFLDRETARIDELIARKERLIERLKEKRQTIISRATTKGLGPSAPMKPSGIDWLGDVPKHWKIRAFRYSARIANGQVDPEQPEYCDLPLIAPNHIESGTGRLLDYDSAADQAAESGKYLFEPGNVLYSKIRPALAKVCIAPERGLCSADMYPITPRNDLRPPFLMYYMLSNEFTSGVVLLSSRVAMPKMNRRDLGGFAILVPPLDEQDAIVKYIRDEHAKIDAARTVVEKATVRLRQYRSALIRPVPKIDRAGNDAGEAGRPVPKLDRARNDAGEAEKPTAE
jgi:type I restriction enzyme S subunit